MAHIDAGKTTTTERILFYTGVNYKIGEVHDGAATMDWMQQEQERGITITSAATTCSWKDHRINIIDTRLGTSTSRSKSSVPFACWTAWSPSSAVSVESNRNRRRSGARLIKYQVPRVAFVNKMDSIGANFDNVVLDDRGPSGSPAAAFAAPDWLGGRVLAASSICWRNGRYFWDDESQGAEFRIDAIPADLAEDAELARDQLVERSCRLRRRGAWPSTSTVRPCRSKNCAARPFVSATLNLDLVPVFCGSAFKNKGVQPLLDGVVDFLPSPLDVPPVEGEAVSPKKKGPKNAREGEAAQIVTRAADDDEPFAALVFKIQ